ncbi:uncharacterized protein [Diadema antillarum]|uniref:uncharacterized protein n=1 Tax=Diadema antillarum TaxID=105358 RepID=UPI003A895B23
MADVEKLKLIRRNTKGGLTRTLNSIDRLLKDTFGEVDTLKGYIAKAESQFKQVESKHAELVENITDEATFEEEETWMGECESRFVETIVRARKSIGSASCGEPPTSQPVTPSTPPTSTPSVVQDPAPPAEAASWQPRSTSPEPIAPLTPSSPMHRHSSCTPKMQKMKFPTFNGDIKDYQRFRTLFQHCAADLTEIECFYQLTQAMINARERNMIKGCINVQRAWQVLDEKYGDQDRVVDSLLRDLENLKPYEIKGKISLNAMTGFVQTLQVFEMQAETIGLSGELNSKIMLSQIKQKMPEGHRIAYYRDVRDEHISDSLGGLVKWLHRQLLLQEKAKSPFPEKTSTCEMGQNRGSKSSNAAAWNPPKQVQSKEGKRSGVPKCPLHVNSNTHFLKMCIKFRNLSLKEKYDVMKKNDICSRCGHDNCPAGKSPYDHKLCQFASPCKVQSCGDDSHFSAICPVVYGGKYQGSSSPQDLSVPPTRPHTTSASVKTVANKDTGALQSVLPTVMGYLRHGNNRQLVRILLDGGSQATLVREGIFSKTEKDIYQDHDLSLVGGTRIRRKLRLLDCFIEDIGGNLSYPVSVTEIDKPCGEAPVVQAEDLQQYPHLREVDIHAASSETVDMLLGVDNTHLMVWEEYILGEKPDEPVAARCPLGWFIQGGRSGGPTALLNYVNVSAIGPLEEFLGLETVALQPRRCKCSTEILNRGATKTMEQSVSQRQDGSYEVRLPWKKSPDSLPDNYNYAVKRLHGLESQFRDRPEEWDVYCKQMRDLQHRGVSRRVSDTEIRQDREAGRKMWFLPHFAVKKDSPTTPVRIVYDAKARFQGHSLNEYLVKGEDLNADLFNVALRFRENEVGVIADIRKMFQAIKISPEDARFHRYVFRENPNQPIQVYELTTVTFGDRPSPTAAIVTLRHVIDRHAPDDEQLKKVVTDQFYMDDLSESVTNVEEAVNLKAKLVETLAKGKFDIRKWQSNVQEVCDSEEDTQTASVLGTKWNLSTDTLIVKEVKPMEDALLTKRKLLAHTASYYDVFGMLSGLLIRPKILLQQLWQLNVDWDTPLNDRPELCRIVSEIKVDLEAASTIEIPRCLIPETLRGKRPLPEVSLHGASDASEDAMGIGVWLRWSETEQTEVQLSFVAARARLTPLKQTSMPQKELQAILLLSRLMVALKDALRFTISYSKMWTDSLTVVRWLRGQSKSFRSFVAYRVGEITSEFDPHQDIAYVPTDQNVIDVVSRGTTAEGMLEVIKGPTYLKQPPESWPKTPQNIHDDTSDPERKKFHVRNAKTLTLKVNAVAHTTAIVDPTSFSNWQRLKMVTARVLSVRDVPKKEWFKKLTQQISRWPSAKLLKEAELYWIRQAQKDINFQDANIMRLDPFFDEGEKVYRVGGRIRHAPISYDTRHPYLLPRESHISLLIVRDGHSLALHGGQLRTAAEVRRRYWVVGDTRLSKRVVKECIVCRRHRGRPVEQKMADLPECRVKPFSPPFQTTLVDYLGPINVKVSRNITAKGYCAVFTCAATRAVHLTCVQDLSTQAFLQALDRFISIRGAPATIISDNGTCFRGAYNTINTLNLRLDQTELREHCSSFKVQWKFGPPGGPHHQGAVERTVQEVKKAMKHLVKADRLPFPEWETVFSQISGLINSRPITAVSSSPLDHPPLAPNHFLIGRGDLPSPDVPCAQYNGDFRKRRELCNAMVDKFWARWMDCIQKLSPRSKNQRAAENLQAGDVVLVIGEDKRRGVWRMAEILQTFPGDDGLVRVVELRYADKSVAKRPVTKLILLMKRTERVDL